jgi:hypothetical protein
MTRYICGGMACSRGTSRISAASSFEGLKCALDDLVGHKAIALGDHHWCLIVLAIAQRRGKACWLQEIEHIVLVIAIHGEWKGR